MERIPPSERIRKELRGLLQRGSQDEGGLSEFLQKGMQLVMQELLEAEVTEYLDRGHYERRGEGSRRGHRNGYKERAVKTAKGEVPVGLPQVRGTEEPYVSKLKVFFGGNTNCLERLTAEMYARGLSTRDIEDALYEATGDRVLSKSSVSRVTEILWRDPGRLSRRGRALRVECAGCHGPIATSQVHGKSATAIDSAISANRGGMGSLTTLTSSQPNAIAALK